MANKPIQNIDELQDLLMQENVDEMNDYPTK